MDNKLIEFNNAFWFDLKGFNNKLVLFFDDYEKALKINPNSWEAYYEKGYSVESSKCKFSLFGKNSA